ncbi:DUF805 domain-containing protein [Sphingomonas sp. BK235]|uniref:DUF805 domain-containing protein n=1 Tax=Sphingomonas sp. BK235 TaxID=2512131 RepID=UPI0010EC280B|nr:DUF805 domain-containing protein [Sphingomonas sp. BK235]TCP33774.1 uncharacterized membrane protein YhaH (DUF805 family) [Sphingomonas sp. BK235]
MIDYLTRPFRLYASFGGRSTRREYWLFVLVVLAGLVVAGALMEVGRAPGSKDPSTLGIAAAALWLCAMLLPGLAVRVRRLHDFDLSGWWVIATLVPFIGFLVAIFIGLRAGEATENRFGPDPRRVAG